MKPQMNAFVSGFAEIVDPSLLKVFDETELELLMAGLPHVNVKDWRDNTKYKSEMFFRWSVIIIEFFFLHYA